MELIGQCVICGRPAGMTCSICGQLVCAKHFEVRSGMCARCNPGARKDRINEKDEENRLLR